MNRAETNAKPFFLTIDTFQHVWCPESILQIAVCNDLLNALAFFLCNGYYLAEGRRTILEIQCYFGEIVKEYPGRCYAQGNGRLYSWSKKLNEDTAWAFYHWLYRTRLRKEWIPRSEHERHKGATILILSFGGGALLGEEEFFRDNGEFVQILCDKGLDALFVEFSAQDSIEN